MGAGSVSGSVSDDHTVAGVVLAAGEGRRLRPLTLERPKPLCPVGNVALVDHAIDRLRPAVGAVAVNVHHGRAAMEGHLADRPVHVSVEAERALGTAGALGHLRPWLDGRAALVVNADAWCRADLVSFLAGWDGERVRIMVSGPAEFGPGSGIVASLMPWSVIERLAPVPSGLYERCWVDHAARAVLDVVGHDGPFVDCGTPAQYLEANHRAIAEHGSSMVADPAPRSVFARVVRSAVGVGAIVEGTVSDSVIWSGARVEAGEHLDRAIRTAAGRTVLVRSTRRAAQPPAGRATGSATGTDSVEAAWVARS